MHKGPLEIGTFKKYYLVSPFFRGKKNSGLGRQLPKGIHNIIYVSQGFRNRGPQRENR